MEHDRHIKLSYEEIYRLKEVSSQEIYPGAQARFIIMMHDYWRLD
jgi:hypothetical protein